MSQDPGRHLLLHDAPEGLLDRSMAAAGRPPSAPRAPLLIAAMAASFLLGVAFDQLFLDETAAPPAAHSAPLAAAEPASEAAPVRLFLRAPEAERVTVAGSWNGWDTEEHPLRRLPDGTFVTTLALSFGQHEYMFVVDGQRWLPDPSAPLARDDGFGQRNSVLEI